MFRNLLKGNIALCGIYSYQSPCVKYQLGGVAGCHTFACEKMTTLLSVSRWPLCPFSYIPKYKQMTAELSVSWWPHFFLWVDDHTFVCEHMTKLLFESRWPLACLWAEHHDLICLKMTTHLSVSRWPHFCLCAETTLWMCGRWPHFFCVADDHNLFRVQMATLLSLRR